MLDWLFELPHTSPVGHALGLIALVCAAGMALGSIKYKGIGLGSAGVLFVGILAAHFSQPISGPMLKFVKEFGLVLFVFTIGLQLGPGFFSSLRSGGMRLNLLAMALVLLTGVLTLVLGWLLGVEPEAIGGLFAGASTNTPALGAVQQVLMDLPAADSQRLALPALACAVSYPVAICGLLATLIAVKVAYQIDPAREAQEYAEQQRHVHEALERRALEIENPLIDGETIDAVCRRAGEGIVISRIRSAGEVEVRTALKNTVIHKGDTLLAVGTARSLDRFEALTGRRSDEDLLAAPGAVTYRKVVVTNREVLGKSPGELGLENLYRVEVTRIARGDIEMSAATNVRLQFGDVLQVVGAEEQLQQAANLLGNSLKKLNETQFIPLFLGLFLGVLLGSVPIALPGLPQAVRLGLAGGPLVIALVLGRVGHLGGMVWHIPLTANLAFREFGVALFFAALGLAAGDQFFAAVMSPRGVLWMFVGLIATVLPLLIVAVGSRTVLKMSFVTLGGMLAGAMTNPPALTFVNNICRSESPALAYATVYPLTTLVRILVAQALAIAFCS